LKKLIQINKVPEDKSKIKFQITLSGVWDWNRDFYRNNNETTVIDHFAFKATDSFQNAILNFIGIKIRSSPLIADLFNDATLTELNVSDEVLEEFKNFYIKYKTPSKNDLQKELLELEARVDIIKKKLANLK